MLRALRACLVLLLPLYGEPQTPQGIAKQIMSPLIHPVKLAITWNRTKLVDLGCFTPGEMTELRKGGSPTITKGEYAGDGIAIDHVLPRAIVPELAARFYNLEAIPAKVNGRKSARITEREAALAKRWHREGLLSNAGLAAVEAAGR